MLGVGGHATAVADRGTRSPSALLRLGGQPGAAVQPFCWRATRADFELITVVAGS